ncbi:MAG TPA: YceI family protein [Longimicrobiales bacterium]|nr:YceI family protein [Longimicrobiales bacterium]
MLARHTRGGVVGLGMVLAMLAGGARGSAQEYVVDRDADRLVRFVSRAAIEEFDGVTDRIDGYVLLDGAALSADTRGDETELYFEVDLGSLETGIGLRNRHMRDNYLEVGEHPYATFKGHIIRTEATSSGDFRVTASGGLAIHGVEQPRDLTCRVTPVGLGYRVVCGFEVLLTDHEIEIPKVMFLKLANEIRLELDFTVTADAGTGERP